MNDLNMLLMASAVDGVMVATPSTLVLMTSTEPCQLQKKPAHLEPSGVARSDGISMVPRKEGKLLSYLQTHLSTITSFHC